MVKIGPLWFSVQTYDAEELMNRPMPGIEPGRCADRIEDFFMVMAGGWNSGWEQYKTAFNIMYECMTSEPGDEPRARYVLLTQHDQFWQDHAARPSKVARLRAMEEQQQQQQGTLQQQQDQQQQKTATPGQQQVQQQQQQQQQQGQQQGSGWFTWWRRRPAALATAEAAAAD